MHLSFRYTTFVWIYTFHLGIHFSFGRTLLFGCALYIRACKVCLGVHFSFGCTLFIRVYTFYLGVHFHLGTQFSFAF